MHLFPYPVRRQISKQEEARSALVLLRAFTFSEGNRLSHMHAAIQSVDHQPGGQCNGATVLSIAIT